MKSLLQLSYIIIACYCVSCRNADKINANLNRYKNANFDIIILRQNIVIFVSPEEQEMNSLKKKHDEGNFYIIADDANFYTASAMEYLDSIQIKYINGNRRKKFGFYNSQNKLVEINHKNYTSSWYAILYNNESKKYKIVDLINFIEDFELFFKDQISLYREDKTSQNVIKYYNDTIKIWEGQYYFKTYDREEILNAYEITIKSLDDIKVKWILDKDFKYYKAQGKIIDTDKIEISFDKTDTICLEKSGNNYFISGYPICMINPGNDNLQIEKIK